MTNELEEAIKERCRLNFDACLEIANNDSISLELFLWLKENYENLCAVQRWGSDDVISEFRWSLDDDAGYQTFEFEECLWGNPLMPEEILLDEVEHADDTAHIETILRNPACPVIILEEVSRISFEDRDWIEGISENELQEIRTLALSLLTR
ncbi:hypothetical protein MCELANE86_00476 [Candidatus Nanopelagicaceae bacterium]